MPRVLYWVRLWNKCPGWGSLDKRQKSSIIFQGKCIAYVVWKSEPLWLCYKAAVLNLTGVLMVNRKLLVWNAWAVPIILKKKKAKKKAHICYNSFLSRKVNFAAGSWLTIFEKNFSWIKKETVRNKSQLAHFSSFHIPVYLYKCPSHFFLLWAVCNSLICSFWLLPVMWQQPKNITFPFIAFHCVEQMATAKYEQEIFQGCLFFFFLQAFFRIIHCPFLILFVSFTKTKMSS